MKSSVIRLAGLAVLGGSLGACTLFGVETESTTTEYKNDSGLQSRVERLEKRVERLEGRLEKHVAGQ